MNRSQEESGGGDAPAVSRFGFAGKVASIFVDSKLTPIAILASILLGAMAVLLLPREEEPQIKVPMVDVMVAMPGATAKEVEERVTRPMEKLLWEVSGVEYLYSTSSPGASLVVVRFLVGENLEDSLVKLNQKLQTNFDRVPHSVSLPLIKPRTIDDVPILALTFHSKEYDHFVLRRLMAQVDDAVKSIDAVAETRVIGGNRRQVRVQLDPLLLASRNLGLGEVIPFIQEANKQTSNGSQVFGNQEFLLQTGRFLESKEEVGNVVVGVFGGKPVYLKEVAHVSDGPEEPNQYVLFGAGGEASGSDEEAAVTLSISKRPGANAVTVVSKVIEKVEGLKGTLIPEAVTVSITRDYGATASEKSNELLLHMGIAVFGVALLILFFLGWRESIVVLLAVPSTLALTLLVFYLYGYTLNRITLFALIFSIGILVDDAIVVVENIVRHHRLPGAEKKSLFQITVEAVDEVGNPTILATWAVIAAILPMAFVGGLMGPYMRPIPIGSSAAMFFSLIIAFTVTPWAAKRILKGHGHKKAEEHKIEDLKKEGIEVDSDSDSDSVTDTSNQAPDDLFTRFYHLVMDPMLARRRWRWTFLGIIIAMLIGAGSMVLFGLVKVKMLPFDNKSEFQIIVNMPEGTTLEHTTRISREIARAIRDEPEVSDYQIYAGTASPFNFNGLVRHYFMRSGPTMADIQVNLLPKHDRDAQSHDIVKRIRPLVKEVAEKYGASVAIAEVPPGPPVLQTLVAEIYGPSEADRLALATAVRGIFENTEGVVDIDWYVEDFQPKVRFLVDDEKAALHGISSGAIARTVQMAVSGLSIDLLHQPAEKEDVNIIIELPREMRSRPEDLLGLRVRSERNPAAPLIPLRELVTVQEGQSEQNIYHKNLKPVIYVTADVAGAAESPVYAIFTMNRALKKLKGDDFGGQSGNLKIYNAVLPFSEEEPAMKWDGEWHITIEVFRDLGLAFLTVLILIYMIMVGWFGSYVIPLVVMAAIPFSLIGILPAHWGMGAFFTATSMIGFMAGAGIVVRNSIILVDFIELRMSHGLPLDKAVTEAGAVRFRPMLLTALAVVVGASVILADPIFQGLAISLMFGEIASLLISRMAVPVMYFMVRKRSLEKSTQN